MGAGNPSGPAWHRRHIGPSAQEKDCYFTMRYSAICRIVKRFSCMWDSAYNVHYVKRFHIVKCGHPGGQQAACAGLRQIVGKLLFLNVMIRLGGRLRRMTHCVASSIRYASCVRAKGLTVRPDAICHLSSSFLICS